MNTVPHCTEQIGNDTDYDDDIIIIVYNMWRLRSNYTNSSSRRTIIIGIQYLCLLAA